MSYRRKRGAPKKHESDKVFRLSGCTIPSIDAKKILKLTEAHDETFNMIIRNFIREGIERHQLSDEYDEEISIRESELQATKKNKEMYLVARKQAIDEAKVTIADFVNINFDALIKRKIQQNKIESFLKNISWETCLEIDIVWAIWDAAVEKHNNDEKIKSDFINARKAIT